MDDVMFIKGLGLISRIEELVTINRSNRSNIVLR